MPDDFGRFIVGVKPAQEGGISEENGLQPVSQMELVENMVKSIPWGHNQRIMYKCSSVQGLM